jgi:hypothetical protein
MSTVRWCRTRMVITGVVGLSSAIPAVHPEALFEADTQTQGLWRWVAPSIAAFLTMAAGLPACVLVIALGRHCDDEWERPSNRANPFHLRNPLLFPHFLSQACAAAGCGRLLSGVLGDVRGLAEGLMLLSAGAGLFVGVHVAMVVFRRRIRADAGI